MSDRIHFRNLAVSPQTGHRCYIRGCPIPCAWDLEYDETEGRRGMYLCDEHFRLIFVPNLPLHDARGTLAPWANEQS